MTFPILTAIVIGQIVVFQFLSIAFTRSLFAAYLGPAETLAGGIAEYIGKASRYRFVMGAVLLLVVLVLALPLPVAVGEHKIILAGVSLVSSVAFALASIVDRRTVRAMRAGLPQSGRKVASLEPRSLSHWYHPVWEIVPVVILLSTVAFTVVFAWRLGRPTAEMWIYQSLQTAFVIGAILYTYRYGVVIPNTSARLAMLHDHPDVALEFGQRLAAKDMQYFMLAKIGVALLLAVSTIEAGLGAMQHSGVSLLNRASWVIVGILLVLFAVYFLSIVELTRNMQRQVEQRSR